MSDTTISSVFLYCNGLNGQIDGLAHSSGSPGFAARTSRILSATLRASSIADEISPHAGSVASNAANRDDRSGTLSGRERTRIGTSSARVHSVGCPARVGQGVRAGALEPAHGAPGPVDAVPAAHRLEDQMEVIGSATT